MDQKKIYNPSQQIVEGEILIKGKTLGRWQPKRFLIDEEQRVFALKSSNPKKKLKPYYLINYQVIHQYKQKQVANQEKKKDRMQFELQSQIGGKNVLMGSESEKQALELMKKLQNMCGKQQSPPIRNSMPASSQGQILVAVPNNQISSSQIVPPQIEQLDYDIPSFFDISQVRQSIQCARSSEYQLDKYELIEKHGQFFIYKNKANPLNFRVTYSKKGNCLQKCITQLEQLSWNKYNLQESHKVKQLEDKSELISEIRLMSNHFRFSREFLYLRYSFKINNIYFLIEKQLEQKGNPKYQKGALKFSVWALSYDNNETKLFYNTEQSMMGLNFIEEDSELIKTYLQQIQFLGLETQQQEENIHQDVIKDQIIVVDSSVTKAQDLNQCKKIQQPIDQQIEKIEQIEQLDKETVQKQLNFEKPIIIQEQQQQQQQQQNVSTTVPLNVQQQLAQDIEQEQNEEFFDCEDEDKIDAMNDKLFIANQINQESQDQDQDVKEVTTQRISMFIQPDTDQNLQKWVEKKMKLFQLGTYNSQALTVIHSVQPSEPDYLNRILVKSVDGGNYILKKDFIREEKNGGLKCVNDEKIQAQKAVVKFLLTKIGTSLLLGKSLTSISMPVSIFEPRSNTERVCNSMGFAPIFLEEAAKISDKYERIKLCLAFSFGFIFTYLSMEKPFNPILGETFQGSFDGCPIYCEQISHHPPICVIQLYGRQYKIDARLELVANFHSNSVVGRNIGGMKIIFENPAQEIRILMAPGGLFGTTFGDKVLNLLEKHHVIDLENKIFAECQFNPDKKYCQYFQGEYINQYDYLVGGIFDVNDSAITRFQKEGYRKYKGVDLKTDVKKIKHTLNGLWTQEIKIDNQKLISIYSDYPVKMQHASHPIASDANFRMDVLEWKLRKFDDSQSQKEKLEIIQRNDRKLREAWKKKKN